MFKTLFADKTPMLKPMQPKHVARVVEIISQTDEDDASEALRSFETYGFDGKFVLLRDGFVIGITGYAVDDQVQDVAWLSWHYLDERFTGQGFGSGLFEDLLNHLNSAGFRMLFIETSDYEEDGAPVYAAAHRMYEKFGARKTVTVPDYYAPGEAKIIYGLENQQRPAPQFEMTAPDKGLSIAGLEEDPECDGVLGIRWEESDVPGTTTLADAVRQARQSRARLVVFVLPADLSMANETDIKTAGFSPCGNLPDFYATGLDQVWWSLKP